jgi:hypothetical protein
MLSFDTFSLFSVFLYTHFFQEIIKNLNLYLLLLGQYITLYKIFSKYCPSGKVARYCIEKKILNSFSIGEYAESI